MVVSARTETNSSSDMSRSFFVISPAIMRKLSASAPVSLATCAISARARASKAGCTNKKNLAPSAARRLIKRPAMNPGKPVMKTVSFQAIAYILKLIELIVAIKLPKYNPAALMQ